MNLAWTFWDVVSPKTAPTRLGEVSCHWTVDEQQGGYRNRLRKVFSAVHIMLPSPKRQARPPGASKTSGDFADPLAVCCGSLKRIGLKSYLLLSALVVR